MDHDARLPVPPEWHILVVRSDFTDDSVWNSVCGAIEADDGEDERYVPTVIRVEDPGFTGIDPHELSRANIGSGIGYVFVFDSLTITGPDNPVLVVNIDIEPDRPGWSFRTIPAEVADIDANLGISNMDFCEFADNVGADGVFRGF